VKPRKSFLLRMSPELYEALDAWAQQELRSVNGQIEYVLQQAVAKHRRAVVEIIEESRETRPEQPHSRRERSDETGRTGS
jgi:hypothetical protein